MEGKVTAATHETHSERGKVLQRIGRKGLQGRDCGGDGFRRREVMEREFMEGEKSKKRTGSKTNNKRLDKAISCLTSTTADEVEAKLK